MKWTIIYTFKFKWIIMVRTLNSFSASGAQSRKLPRHQPRVLLPINSVYFPTLKYILEKNSPLLSELSKRRVDSHYIWYFWYNNITKNSVSSALNSSPQYSVWTTVSGCMSVCAMKKALRLTFGNNWCYCCICSFKSPHMFSWGRCCKWANAHSRMSVQLVSGHVFVQEVDIYHVHR